jgi:ankyrin repeat protein
MKKTFRVKKIFYTFFAAAVLSLFPLSANGKSDKVVETVKTGSADDVKKIFKSNSDFAGITTGSDNETLLMTAVKENRSLDVIKELLKAGIEPGKKSRSGKTALMLACQYESDPAVADAIINYNSFFGFVRKNRVLAKDKDKKTAFDYAKNGSTTEEMSAVLSKYAPDPAIVEQKAAEAAASTADAAAAPAAAIEPAAASAAVTAATPAAAIEPAAASAAVTVTAPSAAITPASAVPVAAPLLTATVPSATASADSSKKQEQTASVPESQPASVKQAAVPASKDKPVPEVRPYEKVYLFDYNELDDDTIGPVPDESDDDTKPVFIPNANDRDAEGRTKLMTASCDGDLKMIGNLLYSGADIQASDDDGWTALMFAARFQDNPEVTATLLKKGAVVGTKNKYGISALQLASGFNQNPNVVSELLKGRSISEEEVRSSFIYAITSEATPSILNVFVDTGMPVNVSYEGKTPLMYAAETNTSTTLISWLIEHGANSGYRTVQGKTAFDFAQQNKHLPHDKVFWSLNTAPVQKKESD